MDPWIDELVYLRSALLSHGKVVGMDVLAKMSPSERDTLKGWIVRQGASGTEMTERTEANGGQQRTTEDDRSHRGAS